MKTQVIGFDAAARDGLSMDNPHIVFDAIRIGRVLNYCFGHIEIPASRTDRVMSLMDAAGFSPRLLPGRLIGTNDGTFYSDGLARDAVS